MQSCVSLFTVFAGKFVQTMSNSRLFCKVSASVCISV